MPLKALEVVNFSADALDPLVNSGLIPSFFSIFSVNTAYGRSDVC